MNRLDRAIGWIAPQAALRRAQARAQLQLAARRYDAGGYSRGTEGWGVPFTSANAEVYYGLPWLRARSHDLTRNNPHARRAVDALTDMLVGDGIRCIPKTGDTALDKKALALWSDWVETAHAAGRQTYYGMQRVSARSIVEGGEAVWRRWRRRRSDGLAVPVQWQIMEGEMIDHLRNQVLDNGDRVIAGVQIDTSERRRAYWLHEQHPGDGMLAMGAASLKSAAVDAAQVLHAYEELRPGQIRGIPWLTPSIIRFRNLDDYEEAEAHRKRFEASYAALVIGNETEGGEAASLGPVVHDGAGHKVERLAPGTVAYLDNGTDVKFTQPALGTGFAPYKRTALQSISVGCGLTYEIISGDLSGTNFSSIKAGLNGTRAAIRAIQRTMLIPLLGNQVYREFIDMAVMAGHLPATVGYGCAWHPPRFEAIDPEKEARGILMQIRAGLVTLPQAIASMGYDVEAQLEEIAEANKLLDKFGIVLDSDARMTSQRGVGQPDNSTPADEDTDLPTPAGDIVDPEMSKDRLRFVLRRISQLARAA